MRSGSRTAESAALANPAFAMIAEERPDALLVLQDAVTMQHRSEIIDFAITPLGDQRQCDAPEVMGYPKFA